MGNLTMQKPHDDRRLGGQPCDEAQPRRAPYAPPRIVKRRSVSRATLFSGGGSPGGVGGLVGSGSSGDTQNRPMRDV